MTRVLHHGDGWEVSYDDEVLLEVEETAKRLAKRNLKMSVDARLFAALLNEVIMNRSAASHLKEAILEAVGDVRLTEEEQASCNDDYFALIMKALKLAREGNATAFWAKRKFYDPTEFGGEGEIHRITHLAIVNPSLVRLKIREKSERAKQVFLVNDGGYWREKERK
jgi:hypothetical protein